MSLFARCKCGHHFDVARLTTESDAPIYKAYCANCAALMILTIDEPASLKGECRCATCGKMHPRASTRGGPMSTPELQHWFHRCLEGTVDADLRQPVRWNGYSWSVDNLLIDFCPWCGEALPDPGPWPADADPEAP